LGKPIAKQQRPKGKAGRLVSPGYREAVSFNHFRVENGESESLGSIEEDQGVGNETREFDRESTTNHRPRRSLGVLALTADPDPSHHRGLCSPLRVP